MSAASTLAPVTNLAPAMPQTLATPVPQHLRALEHANRVRLARAALKRAVLAGDVSVADVIRSCPWEAETMSIGELLRSQRRWGRARTRKFLLSLALNENRTLARLTQRQRGILAAELEARATRRR
jgi:hypothetical protein